MRRRTGPADWSIRYCRPLGAQGKTDVDSVSHCTRSNLIVQPSRAAVTLRFTWWSGIEATVSDLIDWPAASASTRTAGSETLLRVLDGVAGQGDVDPTPFPPETGVGKERCVEATDSGGSQHSWSAGSSHAVLRAIV